MSENLAPALQSAYDLATSFYAKGTDCPLCDGVIKSIAVKGDKIVFLPCGCVFAVAKSIKTATLFPEPRGAKE